MIEATNEFAVSTTVVVPLHYTLNDVAEQYGKERAHEIRKRWFGVVSKLAAYGNVGPYGDPLPWDARPFRTYDLMHAGLARLGEQVGESFLSTNEVMLCHMPLVIGHCASIVTGARHGEGYTLTLRGA